MAGGGAEGAALEDVKKILTLAVRSTRRVGLANAGFKAISACAAPLDCRHGRG